MKLVGVVTQVNAHNPDFFLQDETAGIYIRPSKKLSAGLQQGDQLEVEGKVQDKVGDVKKVFEK